MAKVSRFDDDLMLEAVIQYSELISGKIKATELARWASANVPGLEGIRDYHFMRAMTIKHPKTGKKVERERPCTERIREINASRSAAYGIRCNILLHSADIEQFFLLPRSEQRKLIIQTRGQMDSLIKTNRYHEHENKRVNAENKFLKEQSEELKHKLLELEQMLKLLKEQVKQCIRFVDEEKRREALKQIGIADDAWDMEKLYESAVLKYNEVFSICQVIEANEKQINHFADERDEFFDGIDF